LRVQELLDVCLQDIYIGGESPYIRIVRKGKKTRLVPVMNRTTEHLQEYLSRFHENPSGTDFLFYVVRKGTRTAMSPDNVEKFIKKYGSQARERNREDYAVLVIILIYSGIPDQYICTGMGCRFRFLQNGWAIPRWKQR